MKDNELLDKARIVLARVLKRETTDADVARYLGIKNDTQLPNVRHGRFDLSVYQRACLAELVGERWTDYMVEALMNKARTEQEAEFWRKKLRALRQLKIAAVALGIAISLSIAKPSQAQPQSDRSDGYSGPTVLYNARNKRTWASTLEQILRLWSTSCALIAAIAVKGKALRALRSPFDTWQEATQTAS